MSLLLFFCLGVLLAWPAWHLLQRLRRRAAWMRRLPGFRPRHLRPYRPRARPGGQGSGATEEDPHA
ncbi:hypothetical protein [Azovibrio restrictus]|uniref:hypothetical protein n=1 Tax=Azovibrio restrictus TaxID=146938 RepID=UPI0026F1B1B6|nr:hypothetical protein [Azovibrio restrictus]